MKARCILSGIAAVGVIAVCVLAARNSASAQEGKRHPGFVVLELFTSQGCSSCPPADRLLREVAKEAAEKNKPVYTLSFHVDYWNYLGWKDPYSGKSATDRQRSYAQVFARKNVYTPQLVVNGREEFPGTRRASLVQAISRYLSAPAPGKLTANAANHTEQNELRVSFMSAGMPSGTLIRIALVDSPDANSVSRGENAGSTLSHTSVVRTFQTITLGESKEGTAVVPVPPELDRLTGRLVLFAQDPANMHIRAATSAALADLPPAPLTQASAGQSAAQ